MATTKKTPPSKSPARRAARKLIRKYFRLELLANAPEVDAAERTKAAERAVALQPAVEKALKTMAA